MKPAGYLIGASTCAGPYKIANCLIEERMVYTNKIPCGHMRAPGDPQGFFANESQLDIVARKLGMDPAEFKRKNMLRDGDETPIGGHISHIRGQEALEKAIQLAGYGKAEAEKCRARSVIFRVEPERRRRQRVRDHRRRRQGQSDHAGGRPGRRRAHRDRRSGR